MPDGWKAKVVRPQIVLLYMYLVTFEFRMILLSKCTNMKPNSTVLTSKAESSFPDNLVKRRKQRLKLLKVIYLYLIIFQLDKKGAPPAKDPKKKG